MATDNLVPNLVKSIVDYSDDEQEIENSCPDNREKKIIENCFTDNDNSKKELHVESTSNANRLVIEHDNEKSELPNIDTLGITTSTLITSSANENEFTVKMDDQNTEKSISNNNDTNIKTSLVNEDDLSMNIIIDDQETCLQNKKDICILNTTCVETGVSTNYDNEHGSSDIDFLEIKTSTAEQTIDKIQEKMDVNRTVKNECLSDHSDDDDNDDYSVDSSSSSSDETSSTSSLSSSSTSSESSDSGDDLSLSDVNNLKEDVDDQSIPKTKDEVLPEDLPEEAELKVDLPEDAKLSVVGEVLYLVEQTVVIKGIKDCPALDAETILFKDNRKPFGKVFDVFGPVPSPFYSIRVKKDETLESLDLTTGKQVYYAPDYLDLTNYVFLEQMRKMKGSDASWAHDQEPPVHCIDFSDDEEESKAKAAAKKDRLLKKKSLGENSEDITNSYQERNKVQSGNQSHLVNEQNHEISLRKSTNTGGHISKPNDSFQQNHAISRPRMPPSSLVYHNGHNSESQSNNTPWNQPFGPPISRFPRYEFPYQPGHIDLPFRPPNGPPLRPNSLIDPSRNERRLPFDPRWPQAGFHNGGVDMSGRMPPPVNSSIPPPPLPPPPSNNGYRFPPEQYFHQPEFNLRLPNGHPRNLRPF